jgi:hypothetical protein
MAKKYKGIMPAFVYPPVGVPQIFMHAVHNSYKAGAFQHDWTAAVGARPNKARTINGHNFLQSDAEWIFLVDTDMVWEPSAIITLRQYAEQHNIKAISGFAVMMKHGIWPHAMRHDGFQYVPYGEIEPFSHPIKVDAVGGACFLVHRDVYEEVAEHTRETTEYLWQDEMYAPEIDAMIGEDITFSDRIHKFTDYEIWYHPGAPFQHMKATPYGPKEYLRFIEGLRERINADVYTTNIRTARQ